MIRVKVIGLGGRETKLDMKPHQTIAELIVAAEVCGSKIIHCGQEVFDFSKTLAEVCGNTNVDPETRIFRHLIPLTAGGYLVGPIMGRNTKLRKYMVNAVIAGIDVQGCVIEYHANLLLIKVIRNMSHNDQEPVNTDLLTLKSPEECCIKWLQNGKIFGMNVETFIIWRRTVPLKNPWTNEPLPEPWQTEFRQIYVHDHSNKH
jgi:hypothetical protein